MNVIFVISHILKLAVQHEGDNDRTHTDTQTLKSLKRSQENCLCMQIPLILKQIWGGLKYRLMRT